MIGIGPVPRAPGSPASQKVAAGLGVARPRGVPLFAGVNPYGPQPAGNDLVNRGPFSQGSANALHGILTSGNDLVNRGPFNAGTTHALHGIFPGGNDLVNRGPFNQGSANALRGIRQPLGPIHRLAARLSGLY